MKLSKLQPGVNLFTTTTTSLLLDSSTNLYPEGKPPKYGDITQHPVNIIISPSNNFTVSYMEVSLVLLYTKSLKDDFIYISI